MTKTKSTKRALLMSALALLMCVSMLIGSTFAWFTDSVTSANNKIVAGKLDVQLLMNADGSGYVDISNITSPIFGEGSIAQNNNAQTLWEPGKTQVAYRAIKNNGNLDLKYTVGLNVKNVSKDLYEVMEYAIVPDAQYNSVTSWTTGNSVVVGTQSVSGDVELKVGETHYFALAIHMDEMAGNEYQGGEVNFDLTVLATQLASESDSFNNQYDKNAGYNQGKTNVGPYKLDVLSGGNAVYDEATNTYNVAVVTVAQGGYNAAQGGKYYAGYTVNVEGYAEGATVSFNKNGIDVVWKLADEERGGFINNGIHQQWTSVGTARAYRYDIDGDGVTDFTVYNDASDAKVEAANAEELKKLIESGVSAILTADINMDVTETAFTVANGNTAKLDLNGHDIIATSTSDKNVQLFSVNGNLEIVGNGTISLTNDDFAWTESYRYTPINIREKGVVTLGEGVKVVCEAGSNTASGYAMAYAVDIYTTGTLNVNGASLHSNYIAVRCFYGNSVVNVNSGSITSSRNNWGIWPQSAPGAVITIADGIGYTTDSYGIYIFN